MIRVFLIIFSIVLLTSCVTNDVVDEGGNKSSITESPNAVGKNGPKFENYDGTPLKIAVVGDEPKIKENELITFTQINFGDLQDINSNDYDAVFIMKEFLKKASESKYAELYKTTNLPFFFIQSEKLTYAFTNEDSSYEKARRLSNLEYAVGYYSKEDGHLGWKYGLYNDQESQKNILDVFSRIFKTIEELNYQ